MIIEKYNNSGFPDHLSHVKMTRYGNYFITIHRFLIYSFLVQHMCFLFAYIYNNESVLLAWTCLLTFQRYYKTAVKFTTLYSKYFKMNMSDLDRQIEVLRRCEVIKESEVKALCSKAREILVEESNVQRVDSPVTVRIIIFLALEYTNLN